MKIITCEQGSADWIREHIGRPTASQYHRILTPKTLKASASADRYLADLLAGWALQAPMDDRVTQFMERGQDLEEKAVAYYEYQNDCDTQQVGFVLHPELNTGCSPDRLVGEDGLLEIKCPSASIHMMYLLDFSSVLMDYRCQAQGQLWVTDRKWIDLLSYNPDLPPKIIRHDRDEEFIAVLADRVTEFCERLEAYKVRMIEMGCANPEAA